jgi:aspartate aminotransferase-like enzyme/predicted N-acetyltransferase YhbS
MPNLRFKLASEPSELEQIHRLNFATFVQEIPRYEGDPATGMLVDRFHGENTYVIALDGDRVVGMVALRATRPFSLDAKLENLDSYLPAGRSLCEVRLLAVDPERRRGPVFRGLMRLVVEHGSHLGYDLAVVSATLRQLKLYRHLGFTPFGPCVGTPEARFQPMYVTLEAIQERGMALFTPGNGRHRLLETPAPSPSSSPRVRLLPGPVSLHPEVLGAIAAPPISHRGDEFAATLRRVKARLCELAGARRVSLLFGSGTLANDAVGARLSDENSATDTGGRGIVLSNGEFGERLADHARRFKLPHTVVRADWGDRFDYGAIGEMEFDWLWAVHCETSTGILNDLDALKRICRERGARLCLDCISSIATLPLDLSGVHLASGVSGKGIGSFAGVSMVFHETEIRPSPNGLPRYLDLGCYGAEDTVPYTFCSNLLTALRTALDRQRFEDRYPRIAGLSAQLRAGLRERGLRVLAPDEHASPAVTTIVLPPEASSTRVGHELDQRGYELSYLSSYLIQRNWIQVCLMGEHTSAELEPLPSLLSELTGLPTAART